MLLDLKGNIINKALYVHVDPDNFDWLDEVDDPPPDFGPCCVIEGTTVLLKDGSEKAIENIEIFTATQDGDVLLNIHGSEVYPVALISGPVGNLPVVSLTINTHIKNHTSKATLWHTFMKNSYCINQAAIFENGDTIMTSTGKGTITSINYEEYNGNVWNVFLASKTFKDNLKNMSEEMLYAFLMNSFLGLHPKEHFIFCNGIASGSIMLQKQAIEYRREGFNISLLD